MFRVCGYSRWCSKECRAKALCSTWLPRILMSVFFSNRKKSECRCGDG
ncbi:unnamed protein product [Chondrus crispus]|uniref:Uncharacterized protein n=1 Tax=Chondrus crispus TaxID=2769 RepID=R7Q793_CHOCR|nr:unnamed protein product [Chondrus crispus]CDF33693.1 unnamed protein product [Chondrus crispus]|eukprot:XP_005713512.1 unnamed protein product [Chondrus crispus]